jgi:hypothetical protein
MAREGAIPMTTPTPPEIPFSTINGALSYLMQHSAQELAVIKSAPVFIAALATVLGRLCYSLSRAFFRSEINGLRAHIGEIEAHNALLAEKARDFRRRKKGRSRGVRSPEKKMVKRRLYTPVNG